jgi:hypothetical protein
MRKRPFIKSSKLKILASFTIVGSLYGLLSASRNQNPYYPAVGGDAWVLSKEQRLKAWHWEPSPCWLPSYLLCWFPGGDGFGISNTKSGFYFRSESGRILYFAASTGIGIVFGVVLGTMATLACRFGKSRARTA